MLTNITLAAGALVQELLDAARLQPGDLVVVGCSTSEVAGQKIGTHPGPEIADAILKGLLPPLQERGLFLAAQCCEHLGRALVVPRAAMERHGLLQVNAIPQPKAGGSFGTAAFATLPGAVLVESLDAKAAAGIDIGRTLIGMHMRPVVVPLRLPTKTVGEAAVTAARTRPKFVGGSRAVYDESLM